MISRQVGVTARPAGRGAHLKRSVILGVIAQIAFLAGWLVAETWQGPHYSVVTDTIGDMQAATAPHVFAVACSAAGGVGASAPRSSGCGPSWRAQAGRYVRASMLALGGLAIGNHSRSYPAN